MGNLCIIPARGGSKRIPRKNIREFMGKPILAYPIEIALQSGLFDEVMVSTEDTEIANIAKYHGAQVPFFRSSEASSDVATTADVLLEVVNNYKTKGKIFENICCVYPCTPLLEIKDLHSGYVRLVQESYDTVLSVTHFDFPVQRSLSIKNNKIKFVYPEFALTRSQDLETYYHDAGQFYWLTSRALLDSALIIGSNTGYVILDELDCQDIDTPADWALAEVKYSLKHEKNR